MSEIAGREYVIYVYDGSFEGFLCCVYNFYYNRLKPSDIQSEADYTPSLYDAYDIETDLGQAYRVRYAIESQLGYRNLDFLNQCLFTCLERKEMYMLRYLVKGFKIGAKIYNLQGDEDVSVLVKAHRSLTGERHKFLGLVRFYKAGEFYVSVINPKNQILPLITWHFTQRFSGQSFIIYDKFHKQVLIYAQNSYKIVYVDSMTVPPVSRDEKAMQKLWKQFCDSVAIKERYNPRCRMSFLPKRLWEDLPEMQENL